MGWGTLKGVRTTMRLLFDVGVKLFCSHCKSVDIREEILRDAQKPCHRRVACQSQDH